MLNFTVGPVHSPDCVKLIGSQDVPYFRTTEFSNVMFENEMLIKEFAHAESKAKTVFLTGSGTAAMEAVIMNCFSSDDLVMIINGGSFGQRFVDLCKLHGIAYVEVKTEFGRPVDLSTLESHYSKNVTGLLVNMHETSTGVLYPMNIIGSFCKSHDLFFVVDAISSFLADEFDMQAMGVNVMITSSQKVLACPPGISMLILDQRALIRVNELNTNCLYFNLKSALENAIRGQTPFTPAVSILLQINARLREIKDNGGPKSEVDKIRRQALDFRKKIMSLPLEIVSCSLSNAVTPLHPINVSAYDVFLRLKDHYNIWVCPNGGKLSEKVFRVGHIGNLTLEDNDCLVSALSEMNSCGYL